MARAHRFHRPLTVLLAMGLTLGVLSGCGSEPMPAPTDLGEPGLAQVIDQAPRKATVEFTGTTAKGKPASGGGYTSSEGSFAQISYEQNPELDKVSFITSGSTSWVSFEQRMSSGATRAVDGRVWYTVDVPIDTDLLGFPWSMRELSAGSVLRAYGLIGDEFTLTTTSQVELGPTEAVYRVALTSPGLTPVGTEIRVDGNGEITSLEAVTPTSKLTYTATMGKAEQIVPPAKAESLGAALLSIAPDMARQILTPLIVAPEIDEATVTAAEAKLPSIARYLTLAPGPDRTVTISVLGIPAFSKCLVVPPVTADSLLDPELRDGTCPGV